MATLALSPIPHKFNAMTSRRIPLGDVPNAANSPARQVSHFKRSRDQVEAQENFPIDLQPRTKRQAFDPSSLKLRLSPTKHPNPIRDDRVFSRPSTVSRPTTSFERRLFAAKEAGSQQRIQRQQRQPPEAVENVRRWQQHYKKAILEFVFYFESFPEDVRMRYSKTVRSLGAREEKFFSRAVTHVITKRSIPSQNESSQPTSQAAYTTTIGSSQPRTINPSLLDQHDAQDTTAQPKSKFDFDAHVRRANSSMPRDTEQRKLPTNSVDILSKAQDLGMKVWHVDKLQRIISTIIDVPEEPQHESTRVMFKKPSLTVSKGIREPDLSRMLRHESLHGPSDRDMAAYSTEMVIFKGPYILVRDYDERTKPIVAKEWSKPPRKGDMGEWPQFRAATEGRCPFVEDVSREEIERAKAQQEKFYAQRLARKRETSRNRTVSRTVTPQIMSESEDESQEESGREGEERPALKPHQAMKPPTARCSHQDLSAVPEACPAPVKLPHQTQSPSKTTSVAPFDHLRAAAEPAASGVQPSNITSAIRSQAISSTAAAPFVKAGTSKEVHGLKRKVLEKNAGPALNTIQGRSQQDHRSGRAEAEIPRPRQCRAPSQEILARIHEESVGTTEEEDVWLAEDVRTRRGASRNVQQFKGQQQKKKTESKPGYCENCREKYDDFDEHVVGRRHRRFALDPENWKELDRLLEKLVQTPKLKNDGF